MNNIFKENRLFFIGGPCVIESREITRRIAGELKELCARLDVDFIFKASFDKANRTSIRSFRGPGLDEGLKILQEIKNDFDVFITTDIHEPSQAAPAGEVADVLQIPAFLCRQTDLLSASAKTGKVVNVKKAQFLSYEDMEHVVGKIREAGSEKIALTERGSMFGYGNLIVDYRNIIEMKKLGYPVIMDATHSTQRPGGKAGVSGGNPSYAPFLAKNALVCGADGVFFEVHPDPKSALSDGSNMVRLADFPAILQDLKNLFTFLHAN